jgi:cytochrome c oxidase subunit 3
MTMSVDAHGLPAGATESMAFAPGRFAMWLFVSTEAMLFGALFGVYAVLRQGGAAWPSHEAVGVRWTVGLIATVVMLGSGVTLWRAAVAARAGRKIAARVWIVATLALAGAFLAIKVREYRHKIDHGFYPRLDHRQLFDRADVYYIAAVGADLRERIDRLERRRDEAAGESDTATPDELGQQVELLEVLDRGIIQWTARRVGLANDAVASQQWMDLAAQWILPQPGEASQHAALVAADREQLAAESQAVEQALGQGRAEIAELTSQIAALESQLGQVSSPPTPPPDPNAAAQREALSRQIAALKTDLTAARQTEAERRQVQAGLADRGAAHELVEQAPDGVNAQWGLGLPVVVPGGDRWMNTYYLLTGAHALHLLAGVIVLVVIGLLPLTPLVLAALSNMVIYWQFVDAVWLVIFALIYVI